MKKIKMAVARFFWKRRITLKRLDILLVLDLAGAGLLTGGFFISVIYGNLWGAPIAIIGVAVMFLPLYTMSWQMELPEYKLDRAIRRANALLKDCSPLLIEKGIGLVEKAKATGDTDQLTKWIDILEEYEGTKDEIRELKVEFVDVPKRIRELRQNLADLRQSLTET